MIKRGKNAAAWRALFDEFSKPPAEFNELRVRALALATRLRGWQQERVAELVRGRHVHSEYWSGAYYFNFSLPPTRGIQQVADTTPRLAILKMLKAVGRA